jgi:hypothetical protein
MTTEKCDELERSLIEMAVESWRFARLFSRLVSKLDAGDGTRYVNQLRYFQKKIEDSLEASGMKIVNVEGQPFDPGMAASAINIGDFRTRRSTVWSTRWSNRSSWEQKAFASRVR